MILLGRYRLTTPALVPAHGGRDGKPNLPALSFAEIEIGEFVFTGALQLARVVVAASCRHGRGADSQESGEGEGAEVHGIGFCYDRACVRKKSIN